MVAVEGSRGRRRAVARHEHGARAATAALEPARARHDNAADARRAGLPRPSSSSPAWSKCALSRLSSQPDARSRRRATTQGLERRVARQGEIVRRAAAAGRAAGDAVAIALLALGRAGGPAVRHTPGRMLQPPHPMRDPGRPAGARRVGDGL